MAILTIGIIAVATDLKQINDEEYEITEVTSIVNVTKLRQELTFKQAELDEFTRDVEVNVQECQNLCVERCEVDYYDLLKSEGEKITKIQEILDKIPK